MKPRYGGGVAAWFTGALVNTRYTGESVARSAGNIVLLGFFIASGSSVPECECGGLLGSQGAWQCQVLRGVGC